MAANVFWRWCVEQDHLWAKIIAHKYFLGAPRYDLTRYPFEGKGLVIWNTLQKDANLIKDGLFWICRWGIETLFWSYSWDGFAPLTLQFTHLISLCQRFLATGWDRVSDLKSFSLFG